MKILYNATALTPPLTGVGNYSRRLYEFMPGLDGVEEVRFFSEISEGRVSFTADEALERKRSLSIDRRSVGKKLANALLFRYSTREILDATYHYLPPLRSTARQALAHLNNHQRKKAAGDYLYHETNFVLQAHPGPRVVTIHDLSIFRYPEFHPPERVKVMTSGIEKSVRKADRIITDSCYIRQELIEKFGVDDKIVTSVPLAADDRYRVRTQQECRAVLKSFSLEFQKYLLVIGSVEPRKNLITLIDAYSRLPADIKDEYPLIHIGPSGWNNSAIKAKAEELQRSGHFRSLGYVADAHLPVVYSAAAGFAFPSVYEGFGLPIVEAMSSGIPVLASNASCLPELVGDAGILVDPFSEDSLLEGLRSLLTSGARSSKLVAEGLLRAKSYTWNRTALETLAVYEEAAHG